jgi:hypothetical protein
VRRRSASADNEIPRGTALALPTADVPNPFQEVQVNTRQLLVGSLAFAPLLAAQPLSAQRVRADIRIGGGPIAGRVVIGDGGDYRPRPRGYAVIPRIVRVERIRFDDRDGRDRWYRDFERNARLVILYYDSRDDCYYDQGGPGLQEIEVYARGDRFYLPDDYYGAPSNRGYYGGGYRGGYDGRRRWAEYRRNDRDRDDRDRDDRGRSDARGRWSDRDQRHDGRPDR